MQSKSNEVVERINFQIHIKLITNTISTTFDVYDRISQALSTKSKKFNNTVLINKDEKTKPGFNVFKVKFDMNIYDFGVIDTGKYIHVRLSDAFKHDGVKLKIYYIESLGNKRYYYNISKNIAERINTRCSAQNDIKTEEINAGKSDYSQTISKK